VLSGVGRPAGRPWAGTMTPPVGAPWVRSRDCDPVDPKPCSLGSFARLRVKCLEPRCLGFVRAISSAASGNEVRWVRSRDFGRNDGRRASLGSFARFRRRGPLGSFARFRVKCLKQGSLGFVRAISGATSGIEGPWVRSRDCDRGVWSDGRWVRFAVLSHRRSGQTLLPSIVDAKPGRIPHI
jgi:hypothetical protein